MTTLPIPTKSPLAEADPNSLAELMARDPLQLTDPDVDKIAAVLREQRGKWLIDDKNTRDKPKGKTSVNKVAAPKDLDLKDLGL